MSLRIAGDRNKFAQRLFADLPARYDRLAEWLSFGQNARWRRAMVDRIVPASPKRVLDVASGTAGVALQLADRTSAARRRASISPGACCGSASTTWLRRTRPGVSSW